MLSALLTVSFTGDATWYAPGGSACGITSAPDDLVAALPPTQFSRAECGRQAVVWHGDKHVVVTVTDRCAGCKHGSIDLSRAAFEKIARLGEGRIKVTWFYAEDTPPAYSTGGITHYAPGPLGKELRPARESHRA
jgi:expansin (peptidoglycan-binding protein)